MTAVTETAERWWPRVAIFGVAAVMAGLFAWAIFPDRPIAREPGQLGIRLDITGIVDMQITVPHFASSTRTGILDIDITASSAPYVLDVDMPAGDNVITCTPFCDHNAPQFDLTRPQLVTISYTGPQLGWSDNGRDLDILLPQIGMIASNNQFGPSYVVTEYDIPDGPSYNWGVSPDLQTLQKGKAEWAQPLHLGTEGDLEVDSTSPYFVAVTNPSAAHSDDLFLFLAGAVVGIAGGAFLTALDALAEPLRKRRRTVTTSNKEAVGHKL